MYLAPYFRFHFVICALFFVPAAALRRLCVCVCVNEHIWEDLCQYYFCSSSFTNPGYSQLPTSKSRSWNKKGRKSGETHSSFNKSVSRLCDKSLHLTILVNFLNKFIFLNFDSESTCGVMCLAISYRARALVAKTCFFDRFPIIFYRNESVQYRPTNQTNLDWTYWTNFFLFLIRNRKEKVILSNK